MPQPFVQYPQATWGAFHAFGPTPDGPFRLCSCSRTAVENMIRLLGDPSPRNPLRADWRSLAWGKLAPPAAGARGPFSYDWDPEPGPLTFDGCAALPWGDNLCHRCHQVSPQLRFRPAMYAGPFKQFFGWYIQQTKLRLGFLPNSGFVPSTYLDGVTPPDFVTLFQTARDAHLAAPERLRPLPRAVQDFNNAVESVAREDFGFRGVGDAFIAEGMVFRFIRGFFPDEAVIRHFRPDWLEGLELDVWIPGRQLAVEFQGQQHFKPVEAWGGQQALDDLKERDAHKQWLCHQRGVTLVPIDYREPLTAEHVAHRLGIRPVPGG